MSADESRRRFLALLAGLPFLSITPDMLAAAEQAGLSFGDAKPFDFDMLRKMAQDMADKPYKEPQRPNPEAVKKINYDEQGRIKFNYDLALWRDGPSQYPITFRPVGEYFQKSVRIFALENGQAREVVYRPDYFSYGPASPMNKLAPGESAIAGFWAMESRKTDWQKKEPWATFQGGSYFRAVGELGQVGLSARGIALNTGDHEPEEFPDFRSFWIEPALKEGDPLVVYALLDGPSVTGAFRIAMYRTKGVVMEIENHIFMRKSVERLGIAPLTSMFWYAEYPSAHSHDWRPEVHDSDTLVMWTGTGERIARPLNNPNRIIISSFSDNNPKGFGLAQRDRNYDHYLDGVSYDRRPTAWVEPLNDWGKGKVQLVEIPTDDEVYDNIGVFWIPEKPANSGASFNFKYRLHWLADQPGFPKELARAVALRTGRAGEPGKDRPANAIKLVIEWDGDVLKNIPWGARPKVVASASRGNLSLLRTEPIWYTPRWRSEFDLGGVEGKEPVELRAYLELDGKPLTETWLYQYQP